MSKQYDDYLIKHKDGVFNAFLWLKRNLPEVIHKDGVYGDISWRIEGNHDASKTEPGEYEAYDAYFYGNNKSFEVVNNFNYAWLKHIHKNPHHWQYWVLIQDDPDKGELILDMPYEYIVEMICDWWSFSWSKGDLFEIFNWYDARKDYIKLSNKTRKTVEDILAKMRKKLEGMSIDV